jgi:hypothetical protein
MRWLLAAFTALIVAGSTVAQPVPGGHEAFNYVFDGTKWVPATGAAGGTPGTGSIQTSPAPRTIVTLDVKTVTTGGAAVTAIAAGNRTGGGFLQNPPSATINLCVNEIGVASGTTSNGDTTCIIPGQGYVVTPAAGAVSVVTSDAAHPFSGYGLR